ncbi:hypothetical protein ABFA07_008667 [Porites harrisoni]
MVMMFRLSTIALLVFLTSTFGPSQADIETKIMDMDRKLTALENRLNGAHVQCDDVATGWDQYAHAPIVFLDRQDVKCPEGKFLARFHLVRQRGDPHAPVRFDYRCCKLIL